MKMTVPESGAGSGRSERSDEERAGSASLPEEDAYRRMYQLLLERCEVLQQDNERLLNRINEAKKITKRYKKDVQLLMERLDTYMDGYRTAAVEPDVKPEMAVRYGNRPSSSKSDKSQASNKSNDKQPPSMAKKAVKRKITETKKVEKDPNAPKKPCNAFFQFCQEQRPVVVAETGGETGVPELSKQEVTKQLALRWRALSNEDKKVYVAMFERSKEKYAEEMSAYVRKDISNQ